jgi:ribosomal protein S18 acetylase RimI-like enzyme
MQTANETSSSLCCFINEGYFDQLYNTFLDAFSDYVIPYALTETQFRNHLNLTAVDLGRTAACFDGPDMVGFSLNGFGKWNDVDTVYDAGTGVIPSQRRRGLSRTMFEMMLPNFNAQGIRQFLLEVVTTNAAATNLYKSLGFQVSRELSLLQCDQTVPQADPLPAGVELQEIPEIDWEMLTSFWDAAPSWQNTVEAVDRSKKMKTILGAFADGKCIGYIVFAAKFGRVSQFAVAEEWRGRGIGRALVCGMQGYKSEGYSMQVINIDRSSMPAMNFFRSIGFYERLTQYEMVLEF